MYGYKSGQRKPDELLVQEIRYFVEREGAIPTCTALPRVASAFRIRGVGWHAALALAGFGPPERKRPMLRRSK